MMRHRLAGLKASPSGGFAGLDPTSPLARARSHDGPDPEQDENLADGRRRV